MSIEACPSLSQIFVNFYKFFSNFIHNHRERIYRYYRHSKSSPQIESKFGVFSRNFIAHNPTKPKLLRFGAYVIFIRKYTSVSFLVRKNPENFQAKAEYINPPILIKSISGIQSDCRRLNALCAGKDKRWQTARDRGKHE